MKLKAAGNILLQIVMEMDAYDTVLEAIKAGYIVTVCGVEEDGVTGTLSKMASQDGPGIRLNMEYSLENLLDGEIGDLLVECTPEGADEVFKLTPAKLIGIVVTESGIMYRNMTLDV